MQDLVKGDFRGDRLLNLDFAFQELHATIQKQDACDSLAVFKV